MRNWRHDSGWAGFGSNPVGRRSDKYRKVRVFIKLVIDSHTAQLSNAIFAEASQLPAGVGNCLAADRLRNAGTIPREVLNYNLETLNYLMSLKAWFFRSLQGELRYDLLLFALVYVSLRLVQTGIARAKHSYVTETKRAKSLLHKEKDWLGDLDSNKDSQIQSQETESNQPPDKPLKT